MPKPPLLFSGPAPDAETVSSEEFLRSQEGFFHFLSTVWIPENGAPEDPRELRRFDLEPLRAEHLALVDAGGMPPARGSSMEELWRLHEVMFHRPVTCLLNKDMPDPIATVVPRLRRLAAAQIWDELTALCADPTLERPRPDIAAGICPLLTLVYDRASVSHAITTWIVCNGELHYGDPWPGRSLLCEESNAAGVAARPSDVVTPAWRITRAEFERVVFAVLVHREPLTEAEREAAERDVRMRGMLGALNAGRPAPAMPGMKTVSRLQVAARLGRTWEVKVAINANDDLDEAGELGSPLHNAASQGHLEIVKLLVRYGADYERTDDEGRTPAAVAEANGHAEVAAYLRALEP